jgi:hypothetical protein
MTRPARNILHFPRVSARKRIQVGAHADHNPGHLVFLRQHTGDAPEPTAMLVPWTTIAMRGIAIACAVYAVLAIIGATL